MFLTPSNYGFDEHEKALADAAAAFRSALVTMSTNEPDAISELAYGSLTDDDLSQLYDAGGKIAFPLLGVGKIADLVIKMKRGHLDIYNPMSITESDVIRALTLLYQPCHTVNELCQEGIEYALGLLEGGGNRKWSISDWLFSKQKIKKDPPFMRSDFLSEFTSGMEAFWQSRAEGLEEFNDEKTDRPSHVVFVVIFNKFMCYAVAQEVRNLISLVDTLQRRGSLTRKRIVIPKLKNVGKRALDFFRKATSLGAGTYEPVERFGRVKRLIEICHR